MKKILITGGGGYIGSVATYLFLKSKYEVIVIDNFSTGYRAPLEFLQKKYGKRRLRFYKKDLRSDLTPIFEKEKNISAMVHYAGSCLVNESMEDPAKYFSNNVCGSQNLLSTSLKYKINKFIFSSTCAVYGQAMKVPVNEKHPTNPENPYGESKRIVEKMIEWYGKQCGLEYVILRYFNVCGASDDGLIGDSKSPSVLLVQNAVRGALGIELFKLTCPKVKTKDGTPIRDYINVVDLNTAHLRALKYLGKGGKSTILNLGTGKGNSVLEIIKIVQKVTGIKFEVGKSEPRKGEWAKIFADIKKAKRVLGWKPERKIDDSVKSLVKWYKLKPDGWGY